VAPPDNGLSRRRIALTLGVLLLLITSKYFYLASLTSYYTFYLMEHFGLGVQSAQLHLFIFLFAVAAGTVLGGPIGDRIGRKQVIWFSILGVAPLPCCCPTPTCCGPACCRSSSASFWRRRSRRLSSTPRS